MHCEELVDDWVFIYKRHLCLGRRAVSLALYIPLSRSARQNDYQLRRIHPGTQTPRSQTHPPPCRSRAPFRRRASTASFDADLRDRHLVYEYAVAGHETEGSEGTAEKWRYETWFPNEDHIVYAIHAGFLARGDGHPRKRRLRPRRAPRVSTVLAFSRGHWDRPGDAHRDKRNPEDLARWRRLVQIGSHQPCRPRRASRHRCRFPGGRRPAAHTDGLALCDLRPIMRP